MQKCDEDIRAALDNLPRDLRATFDRALRRIITNKNDSIAQQVFKWLVAAKKPILLEGFREALSIKPGQSDLAPERFINGINRITRWCENLIEIDEEEDTVHFIHSAVKQHLQSSPMSVEFSELHINNLELIDHYLGEICVTYLNLNNFTTTLARRYDVVTPLIITPEAIAKTALQGNRLASSMTAFIKKRNSSHSPKAADLSSMGLFSNFGREDAQSIKNLITAHPFLGYARENWISHTREFRRGKSQTWDLWRQMIVEEHELAEFPWPHIQFTQGDRFVLDWACINQHSSLLDILAPMNTFSNYFQLDAFETAIEQDNPTLFYILLVTNMHKDFRYLLLHQACKRNRGEIVDILLLAGVDLNLYSQLRGSLEYGTTALQTTAIHGHFGVMEKLLAAGTNPDVREYRNGYKESTALQIATALGSLDMVKKLLAAGANPNAPPRWRGFDALRVAVSRGRLDIVEELLAGGARVDSRSRWNFTSLKRASTAHGYREIVEAVLAIGLGPNATPSETFTALRIAAIHGSIKTLEQLRIPGTNVNDTRIFEYVKAAIPDKFCAPLSIMDKEIVSSILAIEKAVKSHDLYLVQKLIATDFDIYGFDYDDDYDDSYLRLAK